jgi:very-short-patch-repair endonuclease
MKVINRKSTKLTRERLRKIQTDAEIKLWSRLRNKSFMDLKFFRQYGIGTYIVDFYCPRKKLVIEVDGSQHFEETQQYYDLKRTEYFNSLGINVLRFNNGNVLMNINEVLQRIYCFLEEPESFMK